MVATMTPPQVYQIVAQMKAMADATPEQARALLVSNPQLCYAVMQAQVLLGMAPQLVAAAREKRHQEQEQRQMEQARQQQELRQQAMAPLPDFSEEAIAAAFGGLDEEHRSLLINVMAMSPEQVQQQPPAEQQHIIQLRQQAVDLIRNNS